MKKYSFLAVVICASFLLLSPTAALAKSHFSFSLNLFDFCTPEPTFRSPHLAPAVPVPVFIAPPPPPVYLPCHPPLYPQRKVVVKEYHHYYHPMPNPCEQELILQPAPAHHHGGCPCCGR